MQTQIIQGSDGILTKIAAGASDGILQGWMSATSTNPQPQRGVPLNGLAYWIVGADYFDVVNGHRYVNQGSVSSTDWICADGSSASMAKLGSCTGGITPPTTTYYNPAQGNAGVMLAGGNLYRNVWSSGTTVPSGGSASTDYVLDYFIIPANCFDSQFRSITFTIGGLFANVASSHVNTTKLFVNPTSYAPQGAITGGTLIASTGAAFMAGNGSNTMGFIIQATIWCSGSNTQISQLMGMVLGASHGGCGVPITNLTQTQTNAMVFALTNNILTGGAYGDMTFYWWEACGSN